MLMVLLHLRPKLSKDLGSGELHFVRKFYFVWRIFYQVSFDRQFENEFRDVTGLTERAEQSTNLKI
jgi:hypothetical protein